MNPPTPTPIPIDPNAVVVEMPDISFWDSAPHSIQTWNAFTEITVLFQGLLIVGLAALILMLLVNLLSQITTSED
jgi:hypothetical protein